MAGKSCCKIESYPTTMTLAVQNSKTKNKVINPHIWIITAYIKLTRLKKVYFFTLFIYQFSFLFLLFVIENSTCIIQNWLYFFPFDSFYFTACILQPYLLKHILFDLFLKVFQLSLSLSLLPVPFSLSLYETTQRTELFFTR